MRAYLDTPRRLTHRCRDVIRMSFKGRALHACIEKITTHNFPKFLDRQVWANIADPDQTALRSGSALFAILSASFGCITLRKSHVVTF